MRFHVLDGSSVLIDLKAAGLLRALAHSPTLKVAPERFGVELTGDAAVIHARFRADAIEPPELMEPADREKMRQNLTGPELLDAARHPSVDFRGSYKGTVEGGTLAGSLVVRGRSTPLSIPIRVSRAWDAFVAVGSWEGTLSGLGIKPYKALFGAIKLEDWIRLRIEARFHEAKGSTVVA